MEWGGPVLMITSMWFSFTYLERNFTLGRIQNLRGSGIKKFPLTKRETLCERDLFSEPIRLAFICLPPSEEISFFLANILKMP